MSFDDSTSESTVTRRHFVFALGRDEASLAAANLRRGPNSGLKLAAAYCSRKEIVRLYLSPISMVYTDVRDLY